MHCAALQSAGVNADFKHKPVYHHSSRLSSVSTIGGGISLETAIADYVETIGVETSGLDKSILKKIGLEALEKARTFYGID